MPVKFEDSDNYGISNSIDFFGDSLTAGAGGTPIPTLIKNLLPYRLTNNYGIGGQTSEQIGLRQGGLPLRLNISGNAFTGLTPITILSINGNLVSDSANKRKLPLSTDASGDTFTLTGTINSISCKITRSTTGTSPNFVEAYTLTPAFSDTSIIPNGSLFMPDIAFNAKDNIQCLWLGRNNAPNFTGVDVIIDKCIAFVDKPRRVLVTGVSNGLNEVIGGSIYNAITSFNNTLRTNYPNNYIEATPPTLEELAEVGYAPNAQDLIEINNGTFPANLRVDNVHFNTLGYQIFTNRIVKKIKELGW